MTERNHTLQDSTFNYTVDKVITVIVISKEAVPAIQKKLTMKYLEKKQNVAFIEALTGMNDWLCWLAGAPNLEK